MGRANLPVGFSTLGRSAYGHRKSSQSWSFPIDPLKQRVDVEAACTSQAPGPGKYEWTPSCTSGVCGKAGRQDNSNARWGVDTCSRSLLGLPAYTETLPPGPGLYLRSKSEFHLTGARHPLAGWRSSVTASWQDYSRRECRTPVFVSKAHERERLGLNSPGPMTAAPVDAVGRQTSSTRATQPRCTFSRAGRFEKLEKSQAASVPGPGAYNY